MEPAIEYASRRVTYTHEVLKVAMLHKQYLHPEMIDRIGAELTMAKDNLVATVARHVKISLGVQETRP